MNNRDRNTLVLDFYIALPMLLAVVASCQVQLDQTSSVFYAWNGERVFCAKNIDTVTGPSQSEITEAMDRAVADQQVIQLFAHTPGKTVPVSLLEFAFAAAKERNLPFLTYRDLLDDSNPRAGINFSFDDSSVSTWFGILELMKQYDVRASFFVSRYQNFDDEAKRQLLALAADGHQIEAHSRTHQRSPDYVENYGVQAFLDDEVLPSLQLLRLDGFSPQIYAYPFGARTSETDRAILPFVKALRSVSFTQLKPVMYDPCPL